MIFDVEIQCGSLIRPPPLIGGIHVIWVISRGSPPSLS